MLGAIFISTGFTFAFLADLWLNNLARHLLFGCSLQISLEASMRCFWPSWKRYSVWLLGISRNLFSFIPFISSPWFISQNLSFVDLRCRDNPTTKTFHLHVADCWPMLRLAPFGKCLLEALRLFVLGWQEQDIVTGATDGVCSASGFRRSVTILNVY